MSEVLNKACVEILERGVFYPQLFYCNDRLQKKCCVCKKTVFKVCFKSKFNSMLLVLINLMTQRGPLLRSNGPSALSELII